MSRTKRPEPQPLAHVYGGEPIELLIRHLGADGDGLATSGDGGTLHVARALPGERILAQPAGPRRGRIEDILSASPDRVEAPCVHLSRCGGCALQHWADAPYEAWKRDLVVRALERAGFPDPAVGALVRSVPGTRRRLDFAVRRVEGGVALGLHAARSRDLIDIQTCPVLHPVLEALLGPLRAVLSSLTGLRRQAEVTANLLDTGPDLLIRADGAASAADRTKLATFAARHGVGRVSWATAGGAPETAILLTAPSICFAGTMVTPPPGAFLQASAVGEAAIVAAVLAGLPRRAGRTRVVELYAGIGTLCVPVAGLSAVLAFEGDEAAALALRRAAGGTRVQAHCRDLARQPLQVSEFAGTACVVLDPPFAGAAKQIALIAAAGVSVVIYVSCNPAALARDAALLREAGYRLERATPIDQFLWSAQIEAVCVFRSARA